jgi:hypothetical protein
MATRSFSTSVSRAPKPVQALPHRHHQLLGGLEPVLGLGIAALLCRSSVSADSTLNWLSIASRSPRSLRLG